MFPVSLQSQVHKEVQLHQNSCQMHATSYMNMGFRDTLHVLY